VKHNLVYGGKVFRYIPLHMTSKQSADAPDITVGCSCCSSRNP